ncbi:hypothetical protein OWV82_005720 [Melia azedarach]|uniref:Uncharacterized protein n=1 Tax=Melia azedarach TaxID=155640 RepID=A0ACC1YGN8_MELAZ|nr:hypothetical protein OWV82_005720 [Melia azedarach]
MPKPSHRCLEKATESRARRTINIFKVLVIGAYFFTNAPNSDSLSSNLDGLSNSFANPVKKKQSYSSLFCCIAIQEKRQELCTYRQHPITVHSCGNPVSNANDCASSKVFADDFLNHRISLRTNGSCCLIKKQYLAAFEHDSSKARKLSLTHTPVLSITNH